MDATAVSGVVVGQEGGAPLESVVIGIGSTTTRTNSAGRFSIRGVPPTYDLVMLERAQHHAHVLRGLTSRSLKLQGSQTKKGPSATVRGVISGGAGLPLPLGHELEVGYFGPNGALHRGVTGPSASTGAYSLNVEWPGWESSDVAGTVYAFGTRKNSSSRVTAFDGFGTKELTVRDTQTYGNQNGSTPATNVALSPVGTHTVTGNVIAPDEPTVLTMTAHVWFADSESFDATAGPYSVLLPTGLPVRSSIELFMEQRVGFDSEYSKVIHPVPDGTDALDVSTLIPPVQLVPAERAEDVDFATDFSWTQPDGAVSTVWFEIAGWTIEVTSTESTGRIPDLHAYGVDLLPLDAGTWHISYNLGPTTVEQWALVGQLYLFGLPDVSRGVGVSFTRKFTLSE